MKNTYKPKGTKWVTIFLRNRLRLILLPALVLIALQGYGQRFSHDYWHEGVITLDDGKVLEGKIKYDFFSDMVQFQSDRGVNEAFTCKRFIKFQIMDELQEVERKFYSLPFHPAQGYESLRMFEVLIEGPMNLLAREEKEVTRRSYNYGVYRAPTQMDLVHSYYILTEGNSIKRFNNKRAELFKYMGRHSSEVQKYMKKNRLNVGNKKELARIIAFYNGLISQQK